MAGQQDAACSPGKGEWLEGGYVSSSDSSKPFFLSAIVARGHLGTHRDRPVLALRKCSVSGKLRPAAGAQVIS